MRSATPYLTSLPLENKVKQARFRPGRNSESMNAGMPRFIVAHAWSSATLSALNEPFPDVDPSAKSRTQNGYVSPTRSGCSMISSRESIWYFGTIGRPARLS